MLRVGGPGIESQSVAKFFLPVKTLGPGAHPVSYKMGTGSFPGVRRPGRGVDHPQSPPRIEVKERVKLYLYFPSGPSWPVLGYLYRTNVKKIEPDMVTTHTASDVACKE